MSEQIIETTVADTAAKAAAVVADAAGKSVDPPLLTKEAVKTNGVVKTATVADAAKDTTEEVAASNWPDDWRERLAGKDDKALQRLKRFKDINGLWSKIENQEKVIRERATALPQRPAEGATEEAIAEWRKEVGLPETAEAYIEALKLPDGKVLGDDDKPVALEFAKRMHAADASPAAVSAAVSYYLDQVEEAAALQIEQDETNWATTSKALKEEMGLADYKRSVAAIELLFEGSPAGLKERFLSARDATGRKIGGDGEVIKWLSSLAFEARPFAAIMDGGSEKTVSSRRAEIRAMLEKNDPKYWTAEIQKEEQDLIAAELRVKGRATAA